MSTVTTRARCIANGVCRPRGAVTRASSSSSSKTPRRCESASAMGDDGVADIAGTTMRAATVTRRQSLTYAACGALTAVSSLDVMTPRRARAFVEADVETMSGATFGNVALSPYVDLDNGYALLSPTDWVKDLPNGMQEIEIHPPSEYGGRRFKVVTRPYGKVTSLRMADLEGEEFATPEAYAYSVASKYAPVAEEGKEVGRGAATCKILNARASEDGRYYFFEYMTENSMLPLHFWGVIGLGPGPVGSARKLGRKDLITLTCQMPEEKGPEAAALLEYIISTFQVLDI